MRRCIAGSALFVMVFLLYHLTFSSVPTSDGYTWIAAVDQRDYDMILLADHPLPLYLISLLKPSLSALGVQVATLSLMQMVNAILAATGAVLLYSVVTLLTSSALIAECGGALLAASFGYWYFANGEIHHFGLVMILAIFLLVLRMRLSGRPYGNGFVIAIALLNSLAVMLHQEHFLFGFAVVAMLMVGRPWRRAMTEGLIYVVAGSIGTAALALAIGVLLLRVSTIKELVRWYFWPIFAADLQPYELGGFPSLLLRWLKAQLTAIVFGTQVVADVIRQPALLGYPKAVWLSGFTLVAYGFVAVLLVKLWKTRRLIQEHLLIPFIGCVVWLVSYKVFLHSWFQTPSTEYHVVTVPPLLLLLLLGSIAAYAEAGTDRRWRTLQAGSVAALLVLVFVINFWGGMLPWLRYGQMKDTLAIQFRTEFRPNDLFISAESGVDTVFQARGNYLRVKELFKDLSKAEGFRFISGLIRDQLRQDGRVFIYNFVPNAFTLRGINQAAVRHGHEPLSPRDFEEFLAELKKRYVLAPVLSYWEESKEPLYLYGERLETLWEVKWRAR